MQLWSGIVRHTSAHSSQTVHDRGKVFKVNMCGSTKRPEPFSVSPKIALKHRSIRRWSRLQQLLKCAKLRITNPFLVAFTETTAKFLDAINIPLSSLSGIVTFLGETLDYCNEPVRPSVCLVQKWTTPKRCKICLWYTYIESNRNVESRFRLVPFSSTLPP